MTESNGQSAVRWAALVAGLVLLNVSLTFSNIWPTAKIRFTSDLSIEAALCVLGIAVAAMWRPARSPRAPRWLAVFWVVLVLGRYADVTSRSLYGRDINLYWDLRLMPDVGAMLAFVADPRLVGAIAAAAILLPAVLYVVSRWALGQVNRAAQDAGARRMLIAVAGIVIVVAIGQAANVPTPEPRFADAVTPVFVRQTMQLVSEATGLGVRPLPAPTPMRSDLARVNGADVFVIFIESYGAVSWDRAAFVSGLAPSRRRLEEAIHHTGRRVVSGFVESTTFGGESWLAHVSLLSGTEVRDEETNVRLMAQQRDTLVTPFAQQGYRTVAIMPGLQRAWPQGEFYGFDEIYGISRLDYHGPPFGWWDITDQFALARMDALAVAPRDRKPVFVFFPTISTHTPFTPTPPYQPDWTRILTPEPYDAEALDRAWSQPPDWLDLGPGYVQALEYIYASIGGYLTLRADRDFVMVLIGDHQPPAMVSGENASWEVPVHVVASRPAVLDRLVQDGFKEGLAPERPGLGRIDALLPILLEAFGDAASPTARQQ